MKAKEEQTIRIVGGGIAGAEAAWQLAQRNLQVTVYEMKPGKFSPAHKSEKLAELVCSNSFRAANPYSAVGMLKEELTRLDSLIIRCAKETAVPAGRALAADRERFSALVSDQLHSHPNIKVIRKEISKLPPPGDMPIIIAAGPLASEPLAEDLRRLIGEEYLAFYDAIAPIVYTESLDHNIVYRASRYEEGHGDYLNCPLDKAQYSELIEAMLAATKVPLHDFEEPKFFEGCLPIEVMAARGKDAPRYGPMKPVGLPDPRSGKEPYAVVQLRHEDISGESCNMVGFQSRMNYKSQQEVFRLIPGMADVEFARLGSIHRNTFVCAPKVLQPTMQIKKRNDLFLAGQISGVEGYVESCASGILTALNVFAFCQGKQLPPPPPDTAIGALLIHLKGREQPGTRSLDFQPSNINFSLFPPIEGKKIPKRLRGEHRAEIASRSFSDWLKDSASY